MEGQKNLRNTIWLTILKPTLLLNLIFTSFIMSKHSFLIVLFCGEVNGVGGKKSMIIRTTKIKWKWNKRKMVRWAVLQRIHNASYKFITRCHQKVHILFNVFSRRKLIWVHLLRFILLSFFPFLYFFFSLFSLFFVSFFFFFFFLFSFYFYLFIFFFVTNFKTCSHLTYFIYNVPYRSFEVFCTKYVDVGRSKFKTKN